MLKAHWQSIKAQNVEVPGAEKTTIRWLIGPENNAPNFHMRLFEVEPGGTTPYHDHPWEHEVFILDGNGQMKTQDGPKDFAAGEFVYVPSGEKHCFTNTGSEVCRFLCLVPADAGK